MTRFEAAVVALLLPAAMGGSPGLAAQTRPVPPAQTPAVPPPSRSAAEPAEEMRVERPIGPLSTDAWGRDVLRIGQDYALDARDVVGQVVVIYGNATIEGRVDRDLVVVFGKVRLASTAAIDGSLIVIGGSVSVASGAAVRRDLVIGGGAFDAPPGFMPGGEHIVIGPAALGARIESVVPWISRGLLWGRLIVPELPWVWGVVGAFFVVYFVLNLVFNRSVGEVAGTMAAKPLTAFVVGLLVLLLVGPVCLLLAVSVIGIAVMPFVICALFAAGIVGKVGVARWIGRSIVGQEPPELPLQAVRSFGLGFAVICLAYMIPVLGLVTWTMVGVFGLGGATLAFMAAYKHERPAAVPNVGAPVSPPAPQPASAPVSAPYQHAAAATPAAVAPAAAAAAFSPHAASAPPPPPSDLVSLPRAAFRDRLAAFVLDVILVALAVQLLQPTRDSTFFLLLLSYHIGFWTWKGTTVGGIICQLRVVRVDGAPLSFADALVRGLSSIFSLAVFGLGCLWILKDPEWQAWHDKIAGTYVVKVPRNWPL
jgi:uncharacterized RDD family membrane protein YckC